VIYSNRSICYSLFIAIGVMMVISGGGKFALAQTSVFEAHTLTGTELKNNALAQKILSEIESFKKHVSQIQQDQNSRDVYSMQVEQQRELAAHLEQEALVALDKQNAPHTPKAAFASFVSTVNDIVAQNIFWGQFDYMTKKVDAGNFAMQQVLDNGGTWDQAIQEFSKHAAITRADMVRVNQDLNIQYGAADPTIQSNFDSNGMLPIDYIKMPSNFYHH
jgi:ribosomal protein S15P/S13E